MIDVGFCQTVLARHESGQDARWWFPEHDLHLSFRQIVEQAQRVCQALMDVGVEPGQRVGILMENGPDYPSLFLGCWFAGAVVVPLRPKPGKLFNFAAYLVRLNGQCDFAAILTHREHMDDLGGILGLLPENLFLSPGCQILAPRAILDPAIIQYSSGSTGQPKGVIVTHRMVVAQLDQINRELASGCRGTQADSTASWLPLNHDMGLFIGLLNPLYLGAHNLLASPRYYMARPRRWFQHMAANRTDLHFTTNTAVSTALPGLAGLEPLDLSRLHMYFGAERVFPAVLRRAEEVLARSGMAPHQFRIGYGMAENTLGAASTRGDAIQRSWFMVHPDRRVEELPGPAEGAAELVSLGTPHDNNHFRILDDTDQVLGPLRLGEICIDGPCVMPGYLANPTSTAKALRDGILHTGDLGFWHRDEVWFHSRQDDLVVVGGRNLAPDDIEDLVESLAFVRPGGAAFVGLVDERSGVQRPCLVVEPKLPVGMDFDQTHVRAIQASVLSAFGIVVSLVQPCAAGGVEKTSSGKKRRQVIAERLRLGLSSVGEAT